MCVCISMPMCHWSSLRVVASMHYTHVASSTRVETSACQLANARVQGIRVSRATRCWVGAGGPLTALTTGAAVPFNHAHRLCAPNSPLE